MVTLLVIAVERYSAVIHPYGNRGKLTFSRLKVCQFTIRQASNLKKVRPSQLKCKKRVSMGLNVKRPKI